MTELAGAALNTAPASCQDEPIEQVTFVSNFLTT